MGTSRRTFLKAGGLGALALAAGGALYRATHTAPPHHFALDGEARAALHAIAPAILAGALPGGGGRAAALNSSIEGVHAAILGLPPVTQKEVQDLFGLLALAPARRLLTGVSGGWAEARVEDVNAFLQDWRLHRLGLLRSAYHALHDLVLGAWYAQPASWAATGYPGPMKELS
ncbi:twin-arginine translocation signal domain-containing protein [Massilia sp. IC2-477]|uniref:twin-arginine translocation signal domain-containing protein n=1 Tax=Massilia sp. IC2-477 TaxID=2887198 RepID=UPI001D122122|nr:twin-arginine translocation signal domain-containing protein [Massilia sp. IC2-477]MCC2956371.1 twin-arginine translocation signal domain-containing protein [Massilia sp. IC2-477]